MEWDAGARKWSASYDDEEGKTIFIGLFDTEWRAILRRDFVMMRAWGMVPESMSFERFLTWRPSVDKGSLYDVEHLMEQAWRERRRSRGVSPAVRRRGN